jgi:mannonate dehydratase
VKKVNVSVGLTDVSMETLSFYRQIGVEEVTMPFKYNTVVRERPLVPHSYVENKKLDDSKWNETELRGVKEVIQSYGLQPTTIRLPLSNDILRGHPGREDAIKEVKKKILMASRLGLKVLTYSFTALRATEGYDSRIGRGRGGADYRDFNFNRIKDLSPLNDIGEINLDKMRRNLEYFLHKVVPVAEEVNVKLAAHPNDPPVPVYRGVAQPLSDLNAFKWLINIVDSPANTLFLDTGVITELGEDAVDVIEYFGEKNRVGTVHFRNVKVILSRYNYVETFIDEGDCDMATCMEAFKEVGYCGGIDPDHTPAIIGDTIDTRIGWAYAIGYIISLRDSIYQ